MYFLSIMDEQKRFVRLDIYDNNKVGQAISHTYSYPYIREVMKDYPTEKIGLEKKLEGKNEI